MIADTTASVAPAARRTRHNEGLSVSRLFTKPGVDPLSEVAWERRRAEIKGPDGKIISSMDDVEVPASWSQSALDIAVDKYFRKAGVPGRGSEFSVRQLVTRVASAIRKSGETQGYFATPVDADAFEAELTYMLVNQYGAFNSPVWFNVGLFESYGIKGDPSGLCAWDRDSGQILETDGCYVRPQVSACFIQSISDDLMDIADFVKREMRLFKFGSGSGANFSNLRGLGEPLSGGGSSSGMMSFLKVFDASAGSIKSGGVTRRAAKMNCVNVDHPDIEQFIEWKAKEEDKALALIKAGYSSDFNGEAYQTVSGQNANNSVRVTDEFMEAVIASKPWDTKWRKSGKVARTLDAKRLFRRMAECAWRCADPGIQFDTTINRWHTTPQSGRINASNPCAEYMSLDDSACNLASLNLVKFLKPKRGQGLSYEFDAKTYVHAASTFTLAQEILVDYAAYPTARIAQNTHDYRQLGLGYANLGAMLMIQGVPYDSATGRAIGGALTAILTGAGYRMSAEIAGAKGPFPGFAHNRVAMLDVMRMHERAVTDIDSTCPTSLVSTARTIWREAVELGEQNGYRNAQATVIAPTGTIGFMMDCDTTGVEPDFALVKHKKLAGGGTMEIVNRSVGAALEVMGYTSSQVDEIVTYLKASGMVEGAPHLKTEHLPAFDCANRCGKVQTVDGQKRHVTGKRFIAPMGHVKMLEAIQPFVSGSISKTVNCPKETTIEEIETLHMEAWKRGLKCIAIYRDDSKHAQVLSSGDGVKADEKTKASVAPVVSIAHVAPAVAQKHGRDEEGEPLEVVSREDDDRSGLAPPKTRRHRLPKPKRPGGDLFELKVGGQKVYVRTGEYADGSVGELFIDLHKDGSTIRSLTNCFAIAVSLGLQHGVPLQEFVDAFTFMKFEPAGAVDHPHIKRAMSIIDAVFRVLAVEYLGEDSYEAYAQQQPTQAELEDIRARKSIKLMLAQVGRGQKPPAKQQSDAVVTTQRTAVNGNGSNGAHKTASFRRPSVSEGQMCTRCGGLTQRSGSCFCCTVCGQSTGCS